MKSQIQLSLCMITNNDERYISRLNELKGLADEIIIADIGSNDRTAELAEKAGARVYKIKWEDSFGKAKNFCMDHAGGRWVLFLRPNETIRSECQDNLKTLLDNPNAEGYLLSAGCRTDRRSISSPVQYLRLLRNRKEYRYKYRSYEMIPDEIISNIQITDIKVDDRRDTGLPWEIPLRTRLFRRDIAEYPDDCYMQYIFGIELLNGEKYGESVPHFQKAYSDMNYQYLFAPHLLKVFGLALLRLARYDEALDVLNEGIEIFPFYTDLLAVRGELYRRQKRYREAIADLNGCLCGKQPVTAVPAAEIPASDILKAMALIHEELMNYRQALACYLQAYGLDGTDCGALDKAAGLVTEEDTDTNDLIENIEMIYRHISDDEARAGFERKIVGQFIRKGYTKTADKFAGLDDKQPSGPVKYVLWSTDFMEKAEKLIKSKAVGAVGASKPQKPSNALLNFYCSLSAAEGSGGQAAVISAGEEPACAGLYVKIGDIYEKKLKNDEALLAYLRALRSDPTDGNAIRKAETFCREDPIRFGELLKRVGRVSNFGLFRRKKDFTNMVYGLIHFQRQEFEQALSFFSQITDDKDVYPAVLAYKTVCVWLGGSESDAVKRLERETISNEALICFFDVCRCHAISRLDEGLGLYPGSEIIEEEKGRIRGRRLTI